MLSDQKYARRSVLKAFGGLTAAVTLGGGSMLASAPMANAAEDGFGLSIVESNEDDPRMWYYRFATEAIEWDPAINILLPEDYHESGASYPVLFLLHGGGVGQDFQVFDPDIRDWAAGKPIIIVMPDGGPAGWYSDPVSSNAGAHNWETFHISQLVPWIDANLRTHGSADGRAVSGFSMGGFGALKYMAKHPDLFGSVSAHSGPASLRRDAGLVTHWANASAAAVELAGGTIYGAPLWDEARVTADNPMENLEDYRDKRIFMVAGNSPDPVNWFDTVNETQVLASQQEFKGALDGAGIAHESYEDPGGHVVRAERVIQDLDGLVAHLRAKA